MFDRHDLSKPGGQLSRQKQSGLDRADFAVVLRKFSALTFRQQKFDYTRDELLNIYLPQVKSALPGIPFNASGLVRDLVEVVPLLTLEGDKYRWAHRSLQEYFVASHICQDAIGDRGEVLAEMAQSERVENYVHVLDLCSELAPNEWRQSVLRVIVQAWVDHRRNVTSHLNALGIPQDQIDARTRITSMMNFGVCADKSAQAGSASDFPHQKITTYYAASTIAVERASGEPYCSSLSLIARVSTPCAFPVAKLDQTYAILSSKLETMGLVEFTASEESVDFQRLQNVLGSEPEATNDFSPSLAINSVEYFDQFNQLMKRNCHRFVS